MNKHVLALGLTEDMTAVSQLYTKPGESSQAIQSEANDILEVIQNHLIQNHQRKNIDGSLGRWFCIKKPRAAHFALVQPGYPERLGYSMLNVF